jgi:CubicO group peptidase (beta-lactamase class C family)
MVLPLLIGCVSSSHQRGANVVAPEMLAARVDSIFGDIRHDAPGCAVGAYRDGELMLEKSYGLANVEDGRRITIRTTFDLGSAAAGRAAWNEQALELVEADVRVNESRYARILYDSSAA